MSNPLHVERELLLKQEGSMGMLWFPAPMPEDLDSVLVIAGDLWTDTKFLTRRYTDGDSWMAKVSKRFKSVIFVLGNHDYWDANLSFEKAQVNAELLRQNISNAYLLENNTVVIDNVKFVGGTLWTDYNNSDPMVVFNATQHMNDYNMIKVGLTYKKVKPADLLKKFVETKKFIKENAFCDNPQQKVVVVTHMAPSEQSVSDLYKQYHEQIQANYLYFTELNNFIVDDVPDVEFWFHGHMHNASEYKIGNCTVACNPRGYVNEKVKYDPYWRVKV